MTNKVLIRVLAILLILLLLWWLYWAILSNEDVNEEIANPSQQVEAIE